MMNSDSKSIVINGANYQFIVNFATQGIGIDFYYQNGVMLENVYQCYCKTKDAEKSFVAVAMMLKSLYDLEFCKVDIKLRYRNENKSR